MNPHCYYSDRDLAERYQVSRPTIWDWVKRNRFPRPVKLSPQVSRWYGETVLEHEAQLAGKETAA